MNESKPNQDLGCLIVTAICLVAAALVLLFCCVGAVNAAPLDPGPEDLDNASDVCGTVCFIVLVVAAAVVWSRERLRRR